MLSVLIVGLGVWAGGAIAACGGWVLALPTLGWTLGLRPAAAAGGGDQTGEPADAGLPAGYRSSAGGLWARELVTAGPQARRFACRGPAWNKIHDAVRWTVQELRHLLPVEEIGTRTIAIHLVRAPLQISRSTGQRILRQPEHNKPAAKKELIPPAKGKTDRLLKAKAKNKVWRRDLTPLTVGGSQLTIAALMDGFSRKILDLKVYGRVPGTRNLLALIKRTIAAFGECCGLYTSGGHLTIIHRTYSGLGRYSYNHYKPKTQPAKYGDHRRTAKIPS